MKNSQTTPQTGNFYVVGGTLRGDAPSYVPRQADIQLLESLKRNDVCYVLTARQMGKSSLMVRTAARLRDDGVSIAVLDLTGLGQNLTAEQWYNGLLERIAQQFGLEDQLEDVWRRNETLGPLQRWVLAVRTVLLPSRHGQPIVIFVDEIDAVRSLAFSTDEFFAGIRELYNRRAHDTDLQKLTFCLMGVASPSDLIRDTRTTPFNIGRRIELTDFTEAEAQPLAQGLGREDKAGSALLRRVLYWTGGHPYLTQRLCQAVADSKGTHDAAGVDRICRDLFLSHRARDRDDNLLFVRERILRSEADTTALLNLYDQVRRGKRVRDDDTNPLVPILRLAGISRVEAGCLKVRNRVYQTVFDREWIVSNTPGAELRRQRAAYTKGLKVAALAVAPVIAFGGYELSKLYKQNASLTSTIITPRPPAFWASFSIASAADVNNGTVSVKTRNANVAVYLDNQQYGHTNKQGDLLIERLPAGDYTIRVEKAGFQSISQAAKVEGQKITSLTFNLQPQVQAVAAAAIQIQGAPEGAKVKLDGADVGSTSADGTFTFTASPGEHSVSLSRDGYLSLETKQQFVQGTTIVLTSALKPDTEGQRWRALANGADLASLETYLKDYPNGRFSSQAREQAEQLEWNTLKSGTDLVALTAFVNKNPQGKYAPQAGALMKSLQEEQEDWLGVRNSKDPAKLRAYKEKYPQGHYSNLADAEISKLETAVVSNQTTNDENAVRALIAKYAGAYRTRDVNALRQIWPTIDGKRFDRLRQSFNLASAIKLEISIGKIDWGPDPGTATVVASGSQNYTPKGDKVNTVAIRIVFHLSKSNGVWLITDAQF